MEIDKKKLAELANLPEQQLAALIGAVVTAAGGSRMQVSAAVRSAPKIREKLLNADEKEIREVTNSLDPALLRQISAIIDGGGKTNV